MIPFRHSRERGNPGKSATSGLPRSREWQPWRLFTRLSKLMNSQKVRKHPFSSFPRTRESRKINHFWTPAFAGVTALETFYETINIRCSMFDVGVFAYLESSLTWSLRLPGRSSLTVYFSPSCIQYQASCIQYQASSIQYPVPSSV